MKNLHERILEIVKTYENNSQTAFAKKIACQQSTFNGYMNEAGQSKIRVTLLNNILRTYPQICRNWLYFGEGDMLGVVEPLNHGGPMSLPVIKYVPLTELGKELHDIIALGTDAGLPQEQLHAAFLGRVGVNYSCWPSHVAENIKRDAIRRDHLAQEA